MQRHLILVAAGGSAALLLAALAFQYVGGLAPCPLCIWQRWPHAAAVPVGALALWAGGVLLPLLGAGAMLAGAGIALYHSGVEQGWWDGPAACAAPDISGLTPEQLLAQIMAAPIVRCDEIPWEMFGLSMAAWNGIASLALAGVWLAAVWRGTVGRRA
jgi:disulfide bond formation protein DsbB